MLEMSLSKNDNVTLRHYSLTFMHCTVCTILAQGPPLRWALLRKYSVFMLSISRNRADTIHTLPGW
jgi:hypothetical protein